MASPLSARGSTKARGKVDVDGERTTFAETVARTTKASQGAGHLEGVRIPAEGVHQARIDLFE